VLVVVQYRYVEQLAQAVLDLETLGALMSSILMAPNVGAMEATVRMISSVSFDWMRMGMPLIPTSASKRAAFPSITGMPATAPMSRGRGWRCRS